MFGTRHVYCPLSEIAETLPQVMELNLGLEILVDNTELVWPQIRWEEIFPIADMIADSGVETTLHGPFYNLNLGARDNHIRTYSLKACLAALEVARAFRSSTMVFHTGFLPQYSPKGREMWFNDFVQSMEPLLDQAADLDVRLAMENTYEQDINLFTAIFEHFATSGLGMCLDAGHTTCFGKATPALWSEVFRERICHIHCSDNDGKEDLHWGLGKGVVDFHKILAPLAHYGTMASVTFEIPVEDAAESKIYFENLVKTLET
jgi:sugar phosphate isomerase/epimerase